MRKLIARVFSYSLSGIVADVGTTYRLSVLPAGHFAGLPRASRAGTEGLPRLRGAG